MRKFTFEALVLLLMAGAVLAGPSGRPDIARTAAESGSFKLLVAALEKSGLLDAVQGKGPLTVFAPTDAAFAKLPAGTVEELLQERNLGNLREILKHHVVVGRLPLAALVSRSSLPTLEGSDLRLRFEGGTLSAGEATVVDADIECSNGIIHVIDTVLVPEQRDLVMIARDAGTFRTLLAAVEAADLVETLRGEGPFTVFAPTDEAFARLPEGTLAALLRPENRPRLIQILTTHVVPQRLTTAEALAGAEIRTLSGATLRARYEEGRLRFGEAGVVAQDVFARNGVVHAIDEVLLPPSPQELRRDAVRETLTRAIDRGVPLFNSGQVDACAALYELAARSLLTLAEEDLADAERALLAATVRSLDGLPDDRARAWALRRAFDRILEGVEPAEEVTGLTPEPEFKPLVEAALPEGFPEPGPVGEVVVKEYPRYRAARAQGGMNAFGTLFGHIKKNEIAMTAPVEMTMEETAGGGMAMKDMAFLYATPSLGEAGTDGRVEVLDLEPARVLSVGLRGPMTVEKIATARKAIEAQVGPDRRWVRDGSWRLLGYNSPMVPEAKRFWELQLPVRPALDN